MQNIAMIRRRNGRAIKQAVKFLGTATKKEVMERTGLSFSTCNNLMNEMAKTNEILTMQEIRPNEMGRPSTVYQLNAVYSLLLCAMVEQHEEGAILRLTLNDLYGNSVEERCLAYHELGKEELETAIARLKEEHPNIAIIGLSIPGILGMDGTVLRCDCPRLKGNDLTQMLSEKFAVPVLCENDMNLMAYGLDWQDEYSEAGSVAVLADYKGIPQGAGLVVDGQILKGNTNFAGEISCLPAVGASHRERLAFQIACMAAIIDPARIAIVGDQCTAEDLPEIQKLLCAVIPSEHCPALTLLENQSCAGKGLVRLCLKALEEAE